MNCQVTWIAKGLGLPKDWDCKKTEVDPTGLKGRFGIPREEICRVISQVKDQDFPKLTARFLLSDELPHEVQRRRTKVTRSFQKMVWVTSRSSQELDLDHAAQLSTALSQATAS